MVKEVHGNERSIESAVVEVQIGRGKAWNLVALVPKES